jgi:Domain of unknown function (DUF4386)
VARITGLVYLAYFLTAMMAEGLHSARLQVASEAVNLFSYGLYCAVVLLLYRLFKPVDRSASLVAMFFGLAGCLVGVLGIVHLALPQINQLFFFACYCLLIGYLIVRSSFLPSALGALMILAGGGWLVFLVPMAHPLAPYLEILGILAEAALMFWLLIAGTGLRLRTARRRT